MRMNLRITSMMKRANDVIGRKKIKPDSTKPKYYGKK